MNQFTVMIILKSIRRTALKSLMNKECMYKRCQVRAIHFSDILKFRYFHYESVRSKGPYYSVEIGICVVLLRSFKFKLNRVAKSIKKYVWSLAL